MASTEPTVDGPETLSGVAAILASLVERHDGKIAAADALRAQLDELDTEALTESHAATRRALKTQLVDAEFIVEMNTIQQQNLRAELGVA